MQAIHRTLLEVNEEFLVSEAPTTPFLQALLDKRVLTDLDLQQLGSLEAQGSRAVTRFVLHVLPLRGPLAYSALLEALQEARAQHLVDLLLEGEAVLQAAVKPIELPETRQTPAKPQAEDPNEYARKLRANKELIEKEVADPAQCLEGPLLQAGVLTSLEVALLERVRGQHALTWSVLWGVLLQRGPRAFRAFMGALLHNGYSSLHRTIQETQVTGEEALKAALSRNTASEDSPQSAPPDDNHNDSPSILPPRPDRGSGTPALHANPRHTEGGARNQQPAPSSNARPQQQQPAPSSNARPHAGPLRPGYSLGDLDFLYTPRSHTGQLSAGSRGAPDRAHVSRSTDALYNPSWADPYNHLRGADVVSPQPVLRGGAVHGAPDIQSAGSLPAPTHPPSPPTGNTDGDGDPTLLAKLDAISERDTESEAGTHTGSKEPTHLSTDGNHDRLPETALEDSGPNHRSSPADRPGLPYSPNADRRSSGARETNGEPVSPDAGPATYRVSSTDRKQQS
ncbi:uncharacterized protein LOC143281739 [Babylonia areolata]|uniref:uncharacterized protein LOC143281739 n=1 Tax=Babylonia areolata TaxID=304850 RepID=UPI003FD0466B